MAQDSWLVKYDAACRLAQDIAENIHERNRQQRTGGNSVKANVTIRASMQNLKVQTSQLKDHLLRTLSTRQITQHEGDRRQNLVDELLTRERQLEASFKNDGTDRDGRYRLMSGGGSHGPSNPWLMEEPEETRGLGFVEIKQQQQRIIEEQDTSLDTLAGVIARQKQMGQDIGNELDEQSGMMVVIVLLLIAIVVVAVWPTS
nr:PREDICTED: syntaxin-8 isoform X2 [Latimeria chalumnae]|eukprot:XP_005989349.1 PREDICTED: syntaxin-8 isoform X2 [Latimeria chalumnae]